MFYLLGRTFEQFITEPAVIVGLALVACGIALGLLSRRITRAVRNTNEVSEKDRLFITLKVLSMFILIAGLMCIAVYIVLYIIHR